LSLNKAGGVTPYIIAFRTIEIESQ